MNIGPTKFATMVTLLRIMLKGGKHYAVPAPDTIRDLLAKYHGHHIKRRWLFQCLADLEAAGLIRRRRRYQRVNLRQWKQKPSLIVFTFGGVEFLYRRSVAGAGRIRQALLNYLNSQSSKPRFPAPPDLSPGCGSLGAILQALAPKLKPG